METSTAPNDKPNQQPNNGIEIQSNNEASNEPSSEPIDHEMLMPYIFFYESDGTDALRCHYFSLSDAVQAMKKARDDVGGFIVPANAAERDAFPYRNKIGPLRDNDSNSWGYRLRWSNRDVLVSLWIEKGPCYPEHDHFGTTLKDELKANRVTREVQELKIDYVVRPGSRVPRGGRFDEGIEDFVFIGEKAYGGGLEDEVDDVANGVSQEKAGWVGNAVAADEDTEMTQ